MPSVTRRSEDTKKRPWETFAFTKMEIGEGGITFSADFETWLTRH